MNGLDISGLRSSSPFGGVSRSHARVARERRLECEGRVVSQVASLAITGEFAGKQGHYNEKNDVTMELKLLHTTEVLREKVYDTKQN